MSARLLQPRFLVLTLATVLMVALTFSLGQWQLRRAAQKHALQAAVDAQKSLPSLDGKGLTAMKNVADAVHREAVLEGRWQAAHTVYLDNRPMDGKSGFWVITPLLLAGSDRAVLVQRGWVPRDAAERSRLPALPLPAGAVEISARIAPPPARLYQFGAELPGAIRQNLVLDDFARETGLSLRPLSVWQLDTPAAVPDGLLRQWAPPAVDVHKHYGYAFQWFALAALITGLYVWFQLIRPRLRRRA
jgi:surfeit locus 1 family protein